MIGFYEALEKLKKELVSPHAKESIFLENSLNRVLAEDLKAKANSPEKATSAMDGYAINSKDFGGKIVIKGFVQAGSKDSFELQRGEALKIFTGALVPEGADVVVKVEEAYELDGELIIKKDSVKEFENIRRAGDSFKLGDLLLKAGTKIGAVEIGLLATLGISEVMVYAKPKVGVVSFGEELIPLSSKKELESQIYSSNNYTLCTYIKELGCSASNLGVIKDDYESSKKVIFEALKSYDVVVTTGGMSKGDFDFIQEILKELAAKEVFKGVKMKPGKPIGIYKKEEKFIVGLPGFPNSAFVTFSLFGKLILKAMLGSKAEFVTQKAILKHKLLKTGDRLEFRPISVCFEEGRLVASEVDKKANSSATINNLIGDSALAILPTEGEYENGSEIDVYMYKRIGE